MLCCFRSRPANEVSQVTADAPEPHWPVEAYQRVFMCEAHALQWYGWNQQRGDPAQPYQYHHLVTQLQKQVTKDKIPGVESLHR